MQGNEEQPGKVQLKTILKGNAARAVVAPAAMAGFNVASFQMNPAARETAEDRLKKEVAALQSQISNLNGEIANLKQKSESDAKAAHNKGLEEGKALGAAEGEKKALKKWDDNLKTLQTQTTQTFEALAVQQKENFEKINAATAEIAIAVAKRIFCEEIAQNPNIISRVLKEAFTFLGQEEKLKVKLNPLDVSSAEETGSFWKPAMTSLKDVELVFDDTIEKGGCILESENGSSVDMRLQTIFGHIEEAVRQIYSSQEPAQFA
jgi:flagellar assembly protein FliH